MKEPSLPEGLNPETVRQVKWLNAVDPRPVQPITSFEQREAAYKREVRSFHLRECSWMLAICGAVSFGLAYLFTHSAALGVQPPEIDWRLLGLIMTIGLMIAPYQMLKPRRPQPGDVEADRALRRAVGMDGTVSS